jgi:hypothetical protein
VSLIAHPGSGARRDRSSGLTGLDLVENGRGSPLTIFSSFPELYSGCSSSSIPGPLQRVVRRTYIVVWILEGMVLWRTSTALEHREGR